MLCKIVKMKIVIKLILIAICCYGTLIFKDFTKNI